MRGMTLKQFAQHRFLRLVEEYRAVKVRLAAGDKAASADFTVLSVALHAAKAGVPRRYWSMVNK